MGFEPLTFYIAHVHIITVASLPTEPPRICMPWSLFIAKSVQLFYLQCYYFFWMNFNEWITVLSCYTCFLLDSIHDGQYSYCVRSIPCLLSYIRLYYIENSHQQDNSCTLQMLWRDCANYNYVWVIILAFMDSNWTATAKTCLWWFVKIKAQTSLRIRAVSSATLLSAFLGESYLHLLREKFQFLASLFSRRDWFKIRFVGNPEDRFSRVVACVACSTALGHILQVQQIIIIKNNEEAVHQIY